MKAADRVLQYLKGTKYLGITYGANQGSLNLAENPEFHQRAKHIDVKHYFIREHIAKETVDLYYIDSAEMVADGLTKPLTAANHTRFLKLLRMSTSLVKLLASGSALRYFINANILCLCEAGFRGLVMPATESEPSPPSSLHRTTAAPSTIFIFHILVSGNTSSRALLFPYRLYTSRLFYITLYRRYPIALYINASLWLAERSQVWIRSVASSKNNTLEAGIMREGVLRGVLRNQHFKKKANGCYKARVVAHGFS
jgi:hypothetical protein